MLELWDRVPEAAQHVGTDRAGVIEVAAETARLAGEPERGLALLAAGFGGSAEARDPERVASLLRLRAALRQQQLLPGQVDDLRTALRLAAVPTTIRAQVLGQFIRVLRLLDRYQEAERLASEMETLAAQLGQEEYRTEAMIRLALLQTGDGSESIPVLQDAVETAQRIGSGHLELLARVEITHVLEAYGDHEAAIEAGQKDLARASRLGLAQYVTAPIAGNLAASLVSAGR